MGYFSQLPTWFWLVLTCWIGACVGSFLNVVIYRVPLGLSVNRPARSFCPTCRQTLAWWHNIPLLSWPLLRGRCGFCRAQVSPRYWAVEILTGLLFLVLAVWFPVAQAICYMVFVSLLIAGSFIDAEHKIIPNRITFGIILSGFFSSALVPSLMNEEVAARGLLASVASAVVGLGLLWLVVELGKLVFGRLTWVFEKATFWSVTQVVEEEPLVLRVGEEELKWTDIFQRVKRDRVVVHCGEVVVDSKVTRGPLVVKIFYDRVEFVDEGGKQRVVPWEEVDSLTGTCSRIVIPREAMGFGDVLLLAGVGAFLGWKAVLFTIFAGAVSGSVWGICGKILGERLFGRQVPFGPFLALGAVLWLFVGPQVFAWYYRVYVAPIF